MANVHIHAEADTETGEMILNPKINTIEESTESYIHEHLHVLMPDEPENVILAMGRAIYHDMTVKEKQKVFRLMARRAKWDD